MNLDISKYDKYWRGYLLYDVASTNDDVTFSLLFLMKDTDPKLSGWSRRKFVKKSLLALGALSIGPDALCNAAFYPARRTLRFYHTHTKDSLDVCFARGNRYDWRGLNQINHYLRDFRTDDIYPIDPALINSLWLLQRDLGSNGVYEVISGYRSPKTNTRLRQKSSGVAKRSLHMAGQAIDVRLRGISTNSLKKHAIALQSGGVGYYQRSDFVHLDTGKVRAW